MAARLPITLNLILRFIADGLLDDFGKLPFTIYSKTVDDTFLVSDDEIIDVMRVMQKEEQ